MVKVKITKNKARIIDDAESTPGQSRQFDLFEFQVMPIFKEKNLDLWRTNFNKLDSDFYVASTNVTNDETIIIFKMNGED
ncbi:MAG: hypothetical protein J6T74_00395 [Clostridia bacterium]|jgi:hypothetical protein|nr:hypothetical protein [Clostridia bacterium]